MRQLSQQIVFLIRTLCRPYDDDRLGFRRCQFVLDQLQHIFPRRWSKPVLFPLHRNLEPVFAIDVFVSEPTVIAHPVLVDVRVKTWLQAVNAILLEFNRNVTSHAATGTYAVHLLHEPWTGLEQEIFTNQCPHWADIHDVSSQFIVQPLQRRSIMRAWNIDLIVRTALN